MSDRPSYQEWMQGARQQESGRSPPLNNVDSEEAEVQGSAFGYVRGPGHSTGAVEFRLRSGERRYFPYSWLGPWRYNPSEGILLKFSGDLITLVLIRGSNLDMPLNEGAINLTTGGLQRHRIVWIQEMEEEDIKRVGEKGPTIDSIVIAEFESQDEIKEWLSKNAPGFA